MNLERSFGIAIVNSQRRDEDANVFVTIRRVARVAWNGKRKENDENERSRRIEESTRTMRSGVEVAVTDDRRHEDR